jgi:hypothetical protein
MVDYQTGAPECPRCGSSADVRTARELFDTMNPAPGPGFQRFSQLFGGAGQAPGQAPGPGPGAAQGQAPAPGQAPGQTQSPHQGGSPAQEQPAGPGQAVGQGGFLQGSFFGQGQPADQGQPAGQGQSPAPGQSPGAGQFPAQGQAAGQFPAQGQPAAPGQFPAQGQPAAPGQFPAQGQPAAPGQFPAQGQPAAPGQFPAPGPFPAQGQGRNDDDYDHYSADNSGWRLGRNRRGRGFDIFHPVDSIADEVGGAVTDAALGFIGRRVKKAFEEKVMPAMQARLEQTQQQAGQQQTEQDAIAARYPDLRACTKDQVIFLVGGYQTIPWSELKLPLTLAQADVVVQQLR